MSATGSGGIIVVGTSRASTWRRVSSTLARNGIQARVVLRYSVAADVPCPGSYARRTMGVVLLKMCLKARLMDGMTPLRQPPAHVIGVSWASAASGNSILSIRAPSPLKNLAAGPQQPGGHLRVDLVPEDGLCKAQERRPRTPSFETGQDVLRWDALGGGDPGGRCPVRH